MIYKLNIGKMKSKKLNSQSDQLSRIEEILKIQNAEPLNFEQACSYLGFKKSYLYKLTCFKQIPFYRPNGKKIYFEKSELNKWLLKNRIKSNDELEAEAGQLISRKAGAL